jgi:hypothetical protein
MPPFRAQLEVHAINLASGLDLWAAVLPHVHVPILEKQRFDFLVRRESEVVEIDAGSGMATVLGRTPKPGAWPRRRGGKVVAAWRTSRGFGLTSLDGQEAFVERRNTREVTLHTSGSDLILQLDDRAFCLVHSDLRVGPEVPIKGYIYGTVATPGSSTVVATAGTGGGIYVVDPSSGALVASHPLPQGAWQVVLVPDAQKAVAVCGPGIAAVDLPSGHLSLEALPCAGAIAGVWGHRVAVLTGEPAPAGIHLIDV